jgi:hypothetical protein
VRLTCTDKAFGWQTYVVSGEYQRELRESIKTEGDASGLTSCDPSGGVYNIHTVTFQQRDRSQVGDEVEVAMRCTVTLCNVILSEGVLQTGANCRK